MMNQTINGGQSYGLIGKNPSPFAEGLVGGDQHRSPLVSRADQFEQNAGFRLILGDIGEVVENQQMASRGELSPSALSDPSVRTLASLGSHQVNTSLGSPRQCTKRPALSRAILVRNCPAQVLRPLKRLNFRITHARNV